MFFRRKNAPSAPIPPQIALGQELMGMLAGYGKLADILADKRKLDKFPETLEGAEVRAQALFLSTGEDGLRRGHTYHYTDDFRTMDPNAQLDLVDMFVGPQMLQSLFSLFAKSGDRGYFDAAVAHIEKQRAVLTCFLRCLARYDYTTLTLQGRAFQTVEEFKNDYLKFQAEDKAAFEALLEKALFPDVLIKTINANPRHFIVMTTVTVQETNPQFVNGVWLRPDIAEPFIKHAIRQQGESLSQRHAGYRASLKRA